ncbi:MotA/TolQ/ExbB proton channel family protein [Candidatus Dependentiae bacterium]|nr:MotA/TolQ/ExbB proton channel family protein [Candidatus Dependentiae bacterium]
MNTSAIGSYGLWSLVLQSDFISRVVLILLFMMSVLSWAVALYKFILFRIKKYQCNQVLQELKSCTKVEEVVLLAQKYNKTLPGYVLIELLTHLRQVRDVQSSEMLQIYADQVLDEVMYREESYTSVLAICSAVATLLGLFGTVWGLVHSFIRISERQSADIVTVAPGIAEALITTAAGLLVAIPSLIFLHYISLRTKDLEHLLVMLCDRVTNLARTANLKANQKTFIDSMETVDNGETQNQQFRS